MAIPPNKEKELKANLKPGQVTNFLVIPRPGEWHEGRGAWFYRASDSGISGKWVSFKDIVCG